MKIYRQHRLQFTLNIVYRSVAMVLRELAVSPEEARKVCETLASQAPEKFSRTAFMEIFHGGQVVADRIAEENKARLRRAQAEARLRYKLKTTQEQHDAEQKRQPVPADSGDQRSRQPGRQKGLADRP